MSRWKLGSMVRINGLFHLLVDGVYWGYKPLTNHLLTSWDIQVDGLFCDVGCWGGEDGSSSFFLWGIDEGDSNCLLTYLQDPWDDSMFTCMNG